MKQTISFVFIALVTMSAMAQTKKYDIKSCTITFEMTQKMSGFDTKNKVVVSFDDYGMKECRETYEGNDISEVFFSDGKDLYTLKPDKKAAFKRGKAYRGTEMKFDWNEISSKDKKAGNAKQLPITTIAGKACESFVYNSDGTKTTYAGWNHILLLIDLTSKDLTSVTRAVKVDEKTSVSADKFKVPAGYAVQ
jgi:hypothetical protein